MESFKELVNEIQVDWDIALQSNFNPLKLTLKVLGNSNTQKDFNETFHRLHLAMNKIVKSNFESFSESFKSFERLNIKNKEIIDKYEQINAILNEIPYLHENLNLISLNATEDYECKKAYEICTDIVEARNFYKEFCLTEDPKRKSKLIVKSLGILKDQQYSQIKGVFEFYKIVYKGYLDYCNQIHTNLLDFAVKNIVSNFQYFPIVIELRSISLFNDFCSEKFYQKVFDYVEETISNSQQIKDCSIELLCRDVAEVIEKTVSNMWILISRFSNLDVADEEDYFGKVKNKKGFIYEIDRSIDVAKQILSKFIDLYSFEFEPENSFDISYISDSVDFSKTFKTDLPVYKRLTASAAQKISRGQFTILTGTCPQIAETLLLFVKTPEIRMFLQEIVQNKKFSGPFLQGKIQEIDNFFFDLDIENLEKLKSLILESLECALPPNSVTELKNYLNKKLIKEFAKIYDQMFQSELIKKPKFNSFLEKTQIENPRITVDELICTIEELQCSLIEKPINKKTLFSKTNKYKISREMIDVLKSFEEKLDSKEMKFLVELFSKSLRRQCVVDFFYFYDLLYRQGNYQYYMKMCFEVIEEIKSHYILEDLEKCFLYYNRMNVQSIKAKNHRELEELVEFLKIFYEIIGPEFNIVKTIEFFKNALNGQSNDKQGRILQKKIG